VSQVNFRALAKHGAALDRRAGTERQHRLIAISCLSHERPGDAYERMVVSAGPGPGDSGHDVEPWHADCLCDVRLMLPEKAPQHGREPDLESLPHPSVRVVLVVPELEDRSHRRSGPDEIRRLRREPLQADEHVGGGFHDGDAGTLCVVAGPLMLEQAAHEEHVAAMPEGEPGLHA
jgi:hypothetical protein